MAYYSVCPDCGCSLDPGEKCDCRKKREQERELFFSRHLDTEPGTGQLVFVFDRKGEEHGQKMCS